MDEEYNFQQDARNAHLVEGVQIRITKTEKKKGYSSNVEVGESKEGHILFCLELDQPLYFYEMNGRGATSVLKKIFIEKDETYIETRTSIYKVTFL